MPPSRFPGFLSRLFGAPARRAAADPRRFEAVAHSAAALQVRGEIRAAAALADAAFETGAATEAGRALFDAACRAGAGALAHECATRLEARLAEAPDAELGAAVANMKKAHHYTLGLISRLEAGSRRAAPAPGRLAYVLQSSLPYIKSGYATRGHGLAQGLRARGLDVICVTRPGFPQVVEALGAPSDAPAADEVDGVAYLRTPPAGKPHKPGYLARAADILETTLAAQRPEWVMAASPYWNALPALIAARRLGLPFFYEVRGFWEVTRASLEPEYKERKIYGERRELEAAVANAADHVFTLTDAMRRELADRGVALSGVSLLPNACDGARFHPSPADPSLRTQWGLPADTPIIGYVGSFEAYEGLDDLIRAAALVRARGRVFRLLLVGGENPAAPDSGALTRMLDQVAAEEGMADWIVRTGSVPHEQARAFYDLIDIAALPRKPMPVTEMVSPLKPLEAMAMEKAILVSSVDALTEMVEDGVSGVIFEKGDASDMADKLIALIDAPRLRAALGRNARAWVLRERTWDAVAERLERRLAAQAGA
ncbi:glycosyltransferase family 4 protein [Pikeienuella sp. HZG-20]|uniref:glycosyltransferase family 4 protein n=1 Tax=Paludibacillus litoralis TaxID=3133267 RepID=UPI0030EF7C99